MSELTNPASPNWFMAAQGCLNILQDVGPYTGVDQTLYSNSETAHRFEEELGKIFSSHPDLMLNELIATRLTRLSLRVSYVEADKWSACQEPVVFVRSFSPTPTPTKEVVTERPQRYAQLGNSALSVVAA